MNNTECNKVYRNFTRIYLPTVYLLVFIFGMFANVLGLKSMFKNWKKFGNVQTFVLNLGIADLLYIFTLPFLAYTEQTKTWIFGETFCKITRYCFNLNLYGSIGFLTCVSVYRYLGIVHPMEVKGRLTNRHSVALTILVWCLVCVQITPDVFFEKTPLNRSFCFDTTIDEHMREYLIYSIGWTVTGFGIPLLVILGCYGHVAVVLSRRDCVDAGLKARCLRLVLTLTVLHAVCFFPFHVLRNLNLKTRILKMEGTCYKSFGTIYIAHQVCRGLACLNCAINPIVYLNVYEDVHMHFRKVKQRARVSLEQMCRIVIISNNSGR